MDGGFYHLKKLLESILNLLPFASKTNFTEQQTLRAHQLSPVCIVVPFWLAVQ
jgi:hypothetical protein